MPAGESEYPAPGVSVGCQAGSRYSTPGRSWKRALRPVVTTMRRVATAVAATTEVVRCPLRPPAMNIGEQLSVRLGHGHVIGLDGQRLLDLDQELGTP